MADEMISKIGWLYTGQQEIQRYLGDLGKVASQTEALNRIGQVRGSAFEGIAKQSQSVGDLNSVLSTSVRKYDELFERILRLRNTEILRKQAVTQLNARGTNYMEDVGGSRELLDNKSRIAVNAASKRLAEAYLKAQQEVEREAAAAQRRAQFGPLADKFFKGDGTVNYPGRNEPDNLNLAQAAQRGVREAQEQAKATQQRRDAEFDATVAEGNRRATITARRTQQEDVALREETGKRISIEKKRTQAEDLAARELTGRQNTITAKRIEAEDVARRNELGRQISIQKKRTQAEDLAAREEVGAQNRITAKRIQAADLAAREEIGRQTKITARRTQQADLAAYEQRAKDAEGARQAARYAGFQPTYQNPATSTPLGRAQGNVNTIERKLFDVTEARTALLARGNYTAREINRVDGALASATGALARARAQVALQQARAGGSSLGAQFASGFRGASDRPYAEQLGQAFKFSVFYGTAYKLLFAFTQTLQATLQEGIQFQQAMTELKIASGQSADAAANMADGLAAQATAAGAAPSQGVILGARSLGLFGATSASGASEAEQSRIAEISARVVSRLALGSKTDPVELQTQVAAVANAFGGGAQGQIRAADLDAYLGRRFGIVPGETIQAVAESATVGQAAGFNQEEVFAIAAALQSRTGQTSSAVAGWMAQIFSRGGEGSLVSLTGKYGIDQSEDLATQVKELADVYKNASNTERAEIAAGFGRGKVQNAAVVLLDEYDTISREAGAARGGATGESDRIFEQRMNDIGGQIQKTVAVMQAFASELGQSGVLDIVGGVIIAFRELVEAATSILQIWNELPGAIKGAIAAIVLLGNASRVAAFASSLSGGRVGGSLLSRAGLITPSLAASTGVRAPTGGIISGAGAGGIAAVGKAALATVAPFALATGGLLAIAALKSSADRMRDAQDTATEVMRNSGLTPESTSSDYIASATELDSVAKQNRDATGWFMNFITAGNADDGNIATAQALEQEARRRREVADAIDERASRTSAPAPAIADFQSDTIQEALDLVTASGGDAEDRLRLLTQALDGTGDSAVRAAAKIDVDFAGRMATAFRDAINGATEAIPLSEKISTKTQVGTKKDFRAVEYQLTEDKFVSTGGRGAGALVPGETATLGEVFDATQTELQDRLAKELEDRNITSLADVDKKTAKELADSIVQSGDFDDRLDGTELDDARGRIVEMIASQLRVEALGWRQLLKKNNDLTAADVASIGEKIDSEFETSREAMPETDLAGRAGSWRRQLRNLLVTKSQAGDGEDISGLLVRIGNARSGVAQSEIARLEAVRRAQQQNATSAAQIRRIGSRSLRQQLRAAIRGGNQDDLAEVLSRAGAGSVDVARKMIENVIDIANTAIRVRAAQAAVAAAAGNIFAGLGAIAGSIPNLASLEEASTLADSLAGMVTGDGLTFSQGNDVEGTDKYFPEAKSAEDRKAEREAQRQEMLELRNNLYLLSIDMTDPLAMATAAVRDARRRLQSDIGSGQDRNTITADRVALRNAQAEREATAFQQRLSAVQTAEELGRISHRKYISYLESESKRLGAIKNRTYQQQQQLDEIDKLMKDAAESMQGQWNFGDIKLPTPYQVRRQVEQMRVDRATQLDAVSGRNQVTTTTINIDGADTGKVRQIIQQTLGSANSTVTTRPRRR